MVTHQLGGPGKASVINHQEPTPDGIPLECTTTVAQPATSGQAAVDNLFAPSAPPPAHAAPPEARGSTAVATRTAPRSVDGMEGEWDETDQKHPVLRIVAGNGALSKLFTVGTLILGDEELLPANKPKDPDPSNFIRFVPIHMTKKYRENLSEEDNKAGVRPRIVSTLAEVEDAGGTTVWQGKEKPSWSPCSTNLLLIEKPAKYDGGAFALGFGDKQYALCLYYASTGSYRNFSPIIRSNMNTTLLIPALDAEGKPMLVPGTTRPIMRPYMPKSFWQFSVGKVASGAYEVFTPKLLLTKEQTSSEIREFINSFANPPQSVEE